ncbi:Hydrogenase maturation protein, carbamoyl dehydratase HypE [Clostridium cavendishii DSM 21758]|uniref:Hydrogenase maturation protein, carbamoyl dehydratase HypE n=1 Tax=Clostridium cavendishii DSM 21758 TaxID=1121302 RepID=A0A1M6HXB8_9CLOT|nr:hydrogenase expression/formation protein HypE [Clostridium cavendishii]SHJ26886.1 Hydrogenase maturation protein, carbamoyl dehydratase HypE [Clostridium cavendishii DSM 21758]
MEIITLSHGEGGKSTHEIINKIFYKHFSNEILMQQGDSSIVKELNGKIAVTTDSYVINPIFFPGGDIGKLSICGTINDLAVSGATPLYITVGFILEEGLKLSDLERIVTSMSETAKVCGVKIIAGDTKVVEKGRGDRLYINTTGIGIIKNDFNLTGTNIKPGDKVIVSGTLGDHGITILCQRTELNFDSQIKSDCNSLHLLIEDILKVSKEVKFIRDITRGGLATNLNEILQEKQVSVVLKEKSIPIKNEVEAVCEILGLDPLYIANEGKLVLIVSSEDADNIIKVMRNNPLGKDATIIGEVIRDSTEQVYLKTAINGTRILGMAEGEIIPRIC